MKKHRKQSVNVFVQKRLVDVPDDNELYKIDNREEYQRRRSKAKHISLDEIVMTEFTSVVTEAYEEVQLLECLHKAVQFLSEKERQLVEYIYYDGLTERETAVILKISQPAVIKRRDKIIQKLRNSLIDWL